MHAANLKGMPEGSDPLLVPSEVAVVELHRDVLGSRASRSEQNRSAALIDYRRPSPSSGMW
jgi:hypothetical protein